MEGRCRSEFACEWTCGVCAAVCRPFAIQYISGAVVVACEDCTGCGDCARVCPYGVLKEEDVARL